MTQPAEVLQKPAMVKSKPAKPMHTTAWSVASVRHALLMHERGDFRMSGMLADAIFRDDRIFGTIESRVVGVLGLPFRAEPADSDTAQETAKRYARKLNEWWFECVPEPAQAEMLRWALVMGFAIGELFWHFKEDGLLYPSLYVHHGASTRWDEDKQAYFVKLADDAWEQVVPGNGRWVLCAPHGTTRPHMRGLIRPLAIPFLIRDYARRDWARRSEYEGTGIRKAMVPKVADPKHVSQFLADLERLGEETTIKLPEGYDLQLVGVDKSASECFEKLLSHGEGSITICVLGQNLTTQVEGGSFAAAGVHKSVSLDRIKSDVTTLETVGREQIVRPWFVYNERNLKPRLIPWPKLDATPPEDLQRFAAALQSLGQSLKALREEGVDVEPLLKRFELRIVQRPEPEQPPPPEGEQPTEDSADEQDEQEPAA